MTDALMNAMKHIGMSADVHMGQFDGDKYTAPTPPQQPKPTTAAPKVAKPMPDAEYETARIAIAGSSTMEDLSKAFTAGYTSAKGYGDKPAMEGLTKVKDIRKNELQQQTQGG